MDVAVWDTYVKKRDSSVLHFDIIVPEIMKNQQTIFGYGKAFIHSKGEGKGTLKTEQCKLCHIEATTPEIEQAIGQQGYYILELDDIPAKLPEHPTRRDLILHLRGHFSKYRFADFQGKSLEEVQQLLTEISASV